MRRGAAGRPRACSEQPGTLPPSEWGVWILPGFVPVLLPPALWRPGSLGWGTSVPHGPSPLPPVLPSVPYMVEPLPCVIGGA